MRIRFALAGVIAFVMWGLYTGTTGAQQLVTVTVAATQPGTIASGCGEEAITPAEFVLTRTGDLTGSLTVSIAWSGGITTATTVSPTSVTFAPGSSTATVKALLASFPQLNGAGNGLTLTVTPGSGYQPGDPSTASTNFQFIAVACPPKTVMNPPPPPVQVNPSFTG